MLVAEEADNSVTQVHSRPEPVAVDNNAERERNRLVHGVRSHDDNALNNGVRGRSRSQKVRYRVSLRERLK